MNSHVRTESRPTSLAQGSAIVVALVLSAPLFMMLFTRPIMRMMGWWFGGAPGTGVGTSPVWGIGIMLLFLLALLGAGYLLYRAVTRGSLGGADPGCA